MNLEQLFDYLLMAFGAVLGWVVRSGHRAHRELAKEVDQCVRKDDFREALRELKGQNSAIFNKLDAIKEAVAEKANRSELLGQQRDL